LEQLTQATEADLASYLLFDGSFAKRLIGLGRADAEARRGEIAEFTGISAPYEEPEAAEFVVDTGELSVEDSVRSVVDYVARNFALTDSAPRD